MPPPTTAVLTDGHCNLCNASVRYLVRRDPEKRLQFAPQQSPTGESLLRTAGLRSGLQEGLVVISGEGALVGPAALKELGKILRPHGGLLLRLCAILPLWLLGPGYRIVARMRYRLFGRQEVCAIEPGTLSMEGRLLPESEAPPGRAR